MSTTVWVREKSTGRLEREMFGYTPFADVPESPYYAPSPGSHLSTRAWLDEDGRHVVMAHDCTTERKVHILRWPTWQALGDHADPSFDCGGCGLHTFVPIAWDEVAAPAAADDAGRPYRPCAGCDSVSDSCRVTGCPAARSPR